MKTIGIFMAGQNGDVLTATSVLKYRNELWGEDCKIVWFISDDNKDLLKHQDIELRTFPRGFGYPEMVIHENLKLMEQGKEPIWEDWLPLVDENNMLNTKLAASYPSLAEFDLGYFPAPHQVPVRSRNGINYPVVSKKVFNIPDSYEWHPVLKFSDEERQRAKEFMDGLPQGVKSCFVETFAGSSQSILSEDMNERNMWICREYWKGCNFIFGSHKFLRGQEQFPDKFFEREGVYSCADFTVRQTALISGACHLILSVSSGLTVAASCWENNPVPILQFCGSAVCGTAELALGEFEMVTADYKKFETSKDEYHDKLIHLLNKHL